jgi:hypothetical protein
MAESDRRWAALAGLVTVLTSAAVTEVSGCGGTDPDTPTSASGAGGAGGRGTNAGGEDTTLSVGPSTGSGPSLCDPPCAAEEVCSHGACVPGQPTCKKDDDCSNDTYCVPAVGCVPWESADPKHDPSCINVIAAGILSPKVKCEFSAAPAGDPFPGHVDVQGTPIVVNFNGWEHPPDGDPVPIGTPSIAASFTATVVGNYTEELGVIRVLSGKDCSLEANLGGTDLDGDAIVDYTVSSASLAAGDLDGDGKAEIVAYGADGSTLAFTRKNGVWGLLWKSPYVAGTPGGPCNPVNHRCPVGWAGPAIHDLDDDGVPEILREGSVLNGATGELRSIAPNGYASYSSGLFSVTANLDQDPAIETTNGQFIWEWQAGGWVQEAYFPGGSASAPGHVAVADFGAYGTGVPANNPELAVVRGGFTMVYAITGELIQQPIAVPGGGGGAPTISDFDNDGLPELAVAGKAFYTIYDIDCGPTPRPGGVCPQATCDHTGGACPPMGGIAWSRSTQDISSNITGSSVFDFEANGVPEIVYGDECFTRVYNGITGEVVFSQYRSSCTWYENPLIADVDGNFRADLVTPSNKACSPDGTGIVCSTLDANGVDPQFAGLRCESGADCASGQCDAGLCRCAADAQCCGAGNDAACLEEGYKCAPPPAGTAGAGNTCRAAHPHGVSGIRVYSDANDKWVRSRTIWNQHAYAVTHVNEDGTIPKSSEWKNNWDTSGLNNFRQNVPGNANGTATGDATAGASTSFACDGSGVSLVAPVCNRGADSIGAGLAVGFYLNGMKLCGGQTTGPLAPDQCELVSCIWANPPINKDMAVDIVVTPNDDGAYAECKDGNNDGLVLDVFCKPAG